jgi:predicted protein tyrosine phosphatase
MTTGLYWVPGRLAVMPRPRGGDWLDDEIRSWRRSGVDVIVSLLTPDEVADLNLADEPELSRAHGVEFHSFPIADRGVPSSREAFSSLMAKLTEHLASGKNIAVHCRQGIGRAALVVICLMIFSGVDPETATLRVSAVRNCPVPETVQQRRWIVDSAQPLTTELPK